MNLHYLQKVIIKNFMYNKNMRFSDLQIEGLTSKHFNYHLQELISKKLLEKSDEGYQLTNAGKDYVGSMDEKSLTIEKLPKVSVAIIVKGTYEEGGERYLLNKRLKQPYFGKVGGYTGKIRFGERFEEAARRELFEETGLSGKFQLAKINRKLAYSTDDDSEIVQDQIMVIFLVTEPTGELVEELPEHRNFWATYDEIMKRDDLFNTFIRTFTDAINHTTENCEIVVEAEGY